MNSQAIFNALGPPLFNFFTASLSQRGKKRKEFWIESPKALLPLKKGGREGFPARPFPSAKVLLQIKKPDPNIIRLSGFAF
jgi:hypothetical protein